MRRPLALGALAIAVASALLLSGCGPTDAGSAPSPSNTDRRPLAELELAEDPRTWVGPSSAVLADEQIEPIAENPEQHLPATVVSHDHSGDRTVVVDDTSRVIALDLAGSIAATVWGLGLGSTLVGRDMSTTFAGSEDLPVVTSGAHAVNAEAVLALRPTLVITDGTIGPRDVLEQLRSAGDRRGVRRERARRSTGRRSSPARSGRRSGCPRRATRSRRGSPRMSRPRSRRSPASRRATRPTASG